MSASPSLTTPLPRPAEDVAPALRGIPGRESTRRKAAPAAPMLGIIGNSRAMQETFRLARLAATSQAGVLLYGETGTGKELLARAIHQGSARAKGPFVAANCAAFPETLLESELFGHVRGAFTGADRSKEGLFRTASGGTLLLDEIADTSLAFQAKLLRVLQEGEVRPVGATRACDVNLRVLATSNRDLRTEIEAGRFRADLFYRLAVFPIETPPLRERRSDIPLLAAHFLALYGEREDRPGCTLGNAAQARLLSHAWPGNVRELEGEIHRALALSQPGEEIGEERFLLGGAAAPEPQVDAAQGETLRSTMARVEIRLLHEALERHDGCRKAAAHELGVTREGLHKKLRRYCLV